MLTSLKAARKAAQSKFRLGRWDVSSKFPAVDERRCTRVRCFLVKSDIHTTLSSTSDPTSGDRSHIRSLLALITVATRGSNYESFCKSIECDDNSTWHYHTLNFEIHNYPSTCVIGVFTLQDFHTRAITSPCIMLFHASSSAPH